MDQHILSWLANRESNRHNTAQEGETQRHNKATELQALRDQLSRERIAWQQNVTNQNIARTQAQANLQAAATHARATEYAASTAATASRYNTNQRYFEAALQHSRDVRRNQIQERYNTSSLAIAASQAQEVERANRAREQENRLSRLQSGILAEKELDYKRETLGYQKEKDWIERAKSEREFETNTRLQMSRQVIDLLGVGAKARLLKSIGGSDYGQGQVKTYQQQQQQETSDWNETYKRLIKELDAKGR